MGHQLVTWPMTSRDLERSRSWPRYIWSQISRKCLEIETWFQWSTNRKLHMEIESSRDRDVTWPWKVKVVTPICSGPYILKTARDRVSYNGTPIGNAIWGYQMAMWPITSRDHKRSRSCPRYIWMQISRKPLQIEARFHWTPKRKRLIEWSRDWLSAWRVRMTSCCFKGKGICSGAIGYLVNGVALDRLRV